MDATVRHATARPASRQLATRLVHRFWERDILVLADDDVVLRKVLCLFPQPGVQPAPAKNNSQQTLAVY